MPAGIRGDVAKLHKKVDRVQRQFDGREFAQTVKELGAAAEKDALDAVRRTTVKRPGATLRDLSMSGWHRRGPVVLATRQTIRTGDSFVSTLITPNRTAGLWRVLESGRMSYRKGDRRVSGVSKSGTVRRRRVNRNVGATEGKGTWEDALHSMNRGSQMRGRAKFQRAMSRAVRA